MSTRMLRRVGARLRRRLPRGDVGSLLPLILVFVLIVLLMIAGMMTSTAAFLAQRDLQADCDSAALWAAAEADAPEVYGDGAASAEYLPLSPEAVAAAVEEHRVRFYSDNPELRMVADVDGEELLVRCRTKVKVPFGGVFGKSDGIERTAESVVRSPTSGTTSEARIITEEELDEMQAEDAETP